MSNLRQIGTAVLMYAQDYDEEFPDGGYGGPRNWEVNMDENPYPSFGASACHDPNGGYAGRTVAGVPGPAFTGCRYGFEFYRILMHIQLGPYTKNHGIWFCPSDKYRKPDERHIAHGAMSYQWFPMWVFNHSALVSNYCAQPPFLENENPAAKGVEFPADRILFSERGMFGWDGPDAPDPNRRSICNHTMGYNILYFDGHVKTMPYGRKKTTMPRTHWPACQ